MYEGPMVEVTEPFPNILKYDNKFYEVDKEFRDTFVLENVISINVDPDGLYTMFYVGTTVDETVHDRWKPDLQTLVAMARPRIGNSVMAPVLQSAELMVAASSDARRKLIETALLAIMEFMED